MSSIEPIVQRGQIRPANWAKSDSEALLKKEDIPGSKENWKWRRLAKVQDLTPTDAGTTYDHLIPNTDAFPRS